MDVLSYLSKKNVDYYVVTEQKHKSLSIVDRFIRIKRDWCHKNEPISHTKIMRFIDNFNHSFHGQSEYHEMNSRIIKILAVDPITERIAKQNEIENSPGSKLNINDHVRLIEIRRLVSNISIISHRIIIVSQIYPVNNVLNLPLMDFIKL
ncbi:MAG: hypothetical protein Ta2E_10910 [Mycoplasmoidaceae bacterium]|nr:MAG: hypothetical protein Ta2E_10910 [Mycoplasmoidaceae bacterium]